MGGPRAGPLLNPTLGFENRVASLEVLERERVSAEGSAAKVEVVGNATEKGECPAGPCGKVQ